MDQDISYIDGPGYCSLHASLHASSQYGSLDGHDSFIRSVRSLSAFPSVLSFFFLCLSFIWSLISLCVLLNLPQFGRLSLCLSVFLFLCCFHLSALPSVCTIFHKEEQLTIRNALHSISMAIEAIFLGNFAGGRQQFLQDSLSPLTR